MKRFRIAVFASGSGTNFQAIADAVKAGRLDVSIGLLVCDKPQAKVVERAAAAGIPAAVIQPKDYDSRSEYDKVILRLLQEKEIDLIVLAGYMRLISSVLLEPYENRIVNIHPALLPAFPGIHAIRQALDYGVKCSGITVHFVDSGMDTGPIIAQRAVPVEEGDTEETLTARIQKAEHELYPQVIGWIAAGKLAVEGRRVKMQTI